MITYRYLRFMLKSWIMAVIYWLQSKRSSKGIETPAKEVFMLKMVVRYFNNTPIDYKYFFLENGWQRLKRPEVYKVRGLEKLTSELTEQGFSVYIHGTPKTNRFGLSMTKTFNLIAEKAVFRAET